MVTYKTQLNLVEIKEGSWELLEDFIFEINGIEYIVPKGFPTDLATIPWPVCIFLPPDGEYKESAVIHDFLLKEMYSGRLDIDRTIASTVFLKSLIYQKIDKVTILILYSGVRFLDGVRFLQYKYK